MKLKVCRHCKTKFAPRNSLQIACSLDCAKVIGQLKTIKDTKTVQNAQKRELIKAKDAIKTRSQWLKEVQVVFNSWVRERDKNLPCISSGRMTGSWDAGHYRSVGSCPELRFEPLNCHRQTVHDNQHLHGNLIEYRKRLIDRIGLDKVEWLESKHEPKKYTIDELKELKILYKNKLKDLQK